MRKRNGILIPTAKKIDKKFSETIGISPFENMKHISYSEHSLPDMVCVNQLFLHHDHIPQDIDKEHMIGDSLHNLVSYVLLLYLFALLYNSFYLSK